jgi:signal transduction histidine kinase
MQADGPVAVRRVGYVRPPHLPADGHRCHDGQVKLVPRPRTPDEAPRPWFRAHPRGAAAVVALLFVGVFVTRLLADESPRDAAGLLYVLPVALAAMSFGRRGGLAAGLFGVSLVVAWALVQDFDLTWLGWVSRVVPLLLLGGLLGDATERLEAAQRRQQQLETAARRHRDAAEISDSLIQGMTAARWALEADRPDVAITTLEDTVARGQRLVSDLLRDADLGPGRQVRAPVGGGGEEGVT